MQNSFYCGFFCCLLVCQVSDVLFNYCYISFCMIRVNYFLGNSVVGMKSLEDPMHSAAMLDINPVNSTVRNPLADISNVASRSGCRNPYSDSERDVMFIDKENGFVPDSVSPTPARHRSRILSSKV